MQPIDPRYRPSYPTEPNYKVNPVSRPSQHRERPSEPYQRGQGDGQNQTPNFQQILQDKLKTKQ